MPKVEIAACDNEGNQTSEFELVALEGKLGKKSIISNDVEVCLEVVDPHKPGARAGYVISATGFGGRGGSISAGRQKMERDFYVLIKHT